MKKTLFTIGALALCLFVMGQKDRASLLRDKLCNSRDYCLVVAHRGDWRNAPENSLQAFQNCIDMGVDMIELDLKMTKDSVLILMHDDRLDRTTTASGLVADYTYDQLRQYRLKAGHGIATDHSIPTLEQALMLCRGKILINIDQGYDYFTEVYRLLVRTGTLNQVVIKSSVTLSRLQREHPGLMDHVIYMPVVSLDQPEAEQFIDSFASVHPVAIECNFGSYTPTVDSLLRKIQHYGMKVWMNSLWPSLNAGHHDDMAVEQHRPDDSWGWILSQGAMIIQTDRPSQLIDYLHSKGLH